MRCVGHQQWGAKAYLEPKLFELKKDDQDKQPSEIAVNVAAGHDFTAVTTTEGNLFTFGRGRYSCLGHGNKQYQAQVNEESQ